MNRILLILVVTLGCQDATPTVSTRDAGKDTLDAKADLPHDDFASVDPDIQSLPDSFRDGGEVTERFCVEAITFQIPDVTRVDTKCSDGVPFLSAQRGDNPSSPIFVVRTEPDALDFAVGAAENISATVGVVGFPSSRFAVTHSTVSTNEIVNHTALSGNTFVVFFPEPRFGSDLGQHTAKLEFVPGGFRFDHVDDFLISYWAVSSDFLNVQHETFQMNQGTSSIGPVVPWDIANAFGLASISGVSASARDSLVTCDFEQSVCLREGTGGNVTVTTQLIRFVTLETTPAFFAFEDLTEVTVFAENPFFIPSANGYDSLFACDEALNDIRSCSVRFSVDDQLLTASRSAPGRASASGFFVRFPAF